MVLPLPTEGSWLMPQSPGETLGTQKLCSLTYLGSPM